MPRPVEQAGINHNLGTDIKIKLTKRPQQLFACKVNGLGADVPGPMDNTHRPTSQLMYAWIEIKVPLARNFEPLQTHSNTLIK